MSNGTEDQLQESHDSKQHGDPSKSSGVVDDKRSIGSPHTTALTDMETRFVWEWLLHENNHLTNRINFFLVAESMLVSAYATLIASGRSETMAAARAIAIGGIVVAIMWWYVSNWTLHKTMFPLRAKARKALPIYDEIYRGRRTLFPAHRLIAQGLPWLIVVIWTVFLVLGAFPAEPLKTASPVVPAVAPRQKPIPSPHTP